jgi:hypothetical protein
MFEINVKPKTIIKKTREQSAKPLTLDELSSNLTNNGFAECNNCKQAILLPNGIYCGKTRYHASNVSDCSFFDLEPIEYKLFRRT